MSVKAWCRKLLDRSCGPAFKAKVWSRPTACVEAALVLLGGRQGHVHDVSELFLWEQRHKRIHCTMNLSTNSGD